MYWQGQPFYGFGLGAACFLDGTRFSRPRAMGAYKRWVEAGGAQQHAPGEPTCWVRCLAAGWSAKAVACWAGGTGDVDHQDDQEEQLLDFIMLGLRTSDGLDLSAVSERFGERYAAVLRAALQRKARAGLVAKFRAEDVWSLTDPEGWLLSNDVISLLFAQVQDSRESILRRRQGHSGT